MWKSILIIAPREMKKKSFLRSNLKLVSGNLLLFLHKKLIFKLDQTEKRKSSFRLFVRANVIIAFVFTEDAKICTFKGPIINVPKIRLHCSAAVLLRTLFFFKTFLPPSSPSASFHACAADIEKETTLTRKRNFFSSSRSLLRMVHI